MKRSKRIAGFCLWVSAVLIGTVWAGSQDVSCRRNKLAERWLESQAPRWNRLLVPIAGFENPGRIEVCIAQSGSPRADYASNRIWLRHLDYEEDRRSVVHEYLHLAFKYSPKAFDETFIENTARQLLEGAL